MRTKSLVVAVILAVIILAGCAQNPSCPGADVSNRDPGNLNGDFTVLAKANVGQTKYQEVGDSGEIQLYADVQSIIRISDNRSASAREDDPIQRINYWEDGDLTSSNGDQILHAFSEGDHTFRVEITTQETAYTLVFAVEAVPMTEPLPTELDYIDSAWVEGDNVIVSIKYSIGYSPEDRDGDPNPSLLDDPSVIGATLGWDSGDERALTDQTPNASGYMGDELLLPEGELSRFALIVDKMGDIWAYPSVVDESEMAYNSEGIFALKPVVAGGTIEVQNRYGDVLYSTEWEDTSSIVEDTLPPGEVGDSLARVTVSDDSLHLYIYDSDSTESAITIGGVVFRSDASNGWGEFAFELDSGDDILTFVFTGMEECVFYDPDEDACLVQVVQSGFAKRRVLY